MLKSLKNIAKKVRTNSSKKISEGHLTLLQDVTALGQKYRRIAVAFLKILPKKHLCISNHKIILSQSPMLQRVYIRTAYIDTISVILLSKL